MTDADPFALALQDIFASPVTAEAKYLPAGEQVIHLPDGSLFGERLIRALRSRATVELAFNEGNAIAATEIALIPRADVPNPRKGDRLRFGADRFVVKGKPRLDIEATEWTCELEPVA